MTRHTRQFGPLLLILVVVALVPVLFGVGGITNLLEQVFAFALFAMSYDLLIGYTGVVSFGHAVFFGTGAYVVGIFLAHSGGSSGGLLVGTCVALGMSILLSLLIASISLRIRTVYFAMITLAVGQTFYVLSGSQMLQPLTNADDGMTVPLPVWLTHDRPVYYFSLAVLVLCLVLLRLFVRSPVGLVLQGIRENEGRVLTLGHSVYRFKSIAFVISGLMATVAGILYVIAQTFVSTGVYDVSISLDVLLMTIIGGIGTLYGGLLGALIIIVAQTEFTNLAGTYPIFGRYTILFGVLYIVIVRFMPRGIVGTILESIKRRSGQEG
ncbi:MAG: branched-chain amino acid ABC transporter permease [Firmicutes bacterium]|nr:branched-chain amino acid ABC transporter permease [Bacillota bacterium]